MPPQVRRHSPATDGFAESGVIARSSLLGAVALCAAGAVAAQDAVRGSQIYRALPGDPGVGSCISCHGEPANNRNSVLRGAGGASVISRTIGAVGAMGYLRQYLADADLADIAAYLGTVAPPGMLEAAPDIVPTADHFGAQAVGTQSSEREVLVRNRQPRGDMSIGAVLGSDEAQFPLRHDCPLALPPLGECRIRIAFRPAAAGPQSATFRIVDSGGQTVRIGAVAGTGTTGAAGALAWQSTPDFAFGPVASGVQITRRAVLANPSPQAATLTRLRVTGPNASRFSLDSDCPAGSRVEAGASCELRLSFVPSQLGLVEGWIEIESDAANAPLARVSATGVAAPAREPPPAETTEPPGGGSISIGWLAALAAGVAALRRRR